MIPTRGMSAISEQVGWRGKREEERSVLTAEEFITASHLGICPPRQNPPVDNMLEPKQHKIKEM